MTVECESLRDSVKIVVTNARRLFEDAKRMEEWESFPTAHALCILSQEEYGKAFLLHLSAEQMIPWSPSVQRGLNNHTCKQLMALMLEYIHRKDFLELRDDPNSFRGASVLPEYIVDAVHIVVLEHFKGWARADWVYENERRVHPLANRIARGVLDREKQTGLYVHIGPDGAVRKQPGLIDTNRCRAEMSRTERVSNAFWFYEDKVNLGASFDWEKVTAMFQLLTGTMSAEEFENNWWA